MVKTEGEWILTIPISEVVLLISDYRDHHSSEPPKGDVTFLRITPDVEPVNLAIAKTATMAIRPPLNRKAARRLACKKNLASTAI